MQHNNTGLTRVQGAGPEKPYTMPFNYNSSLEQLEAMINSAEYCEQETAYHCKKSRLLNTPSKCMIPNLSLLTLIDRTACTGHTVTEKVKIIIIKKIKQIVALQNRVKSLFLSWIPLCSACSLMQEGQRFAEEFPL